METIQELSEELICLVCMSLGRFEEKGEVRDNDMYDIFLKICHIWMPGQEDNKMFQGMSYIVFREKYEELVTLIKNFPEDKVLTREDVKRIAREAYPEPEEIRIMS